MGNIENKAALARNLRKFLELRGMQDKALMDITGASQTAISEWLNAKKYPRIDKIEKMANYFGVPKSALIEDGDYGNRGDIERMVHNLLLSLPDAYKLAAIDYLQFLASKAKDDKNSPAGNP